MKFFLYLMISIFAMMSLVVYAICTREQFYPVILFLVTSKVSMIISGNVILAIALFIAKASKTIFFGDLREAEREILVDRAKYTIIEMIIALSIFRNEITPNVFCYFGLILFLKSFHWISKCRLDHFDQVMPNSVLVHVRLTSLLTVLFFVDSALAYNCSKYALEKGRSIYILFGSEFWLIFISLMNLIGRYVLFGLDNVRTNGLPNRGLYVMIIDVVCGFVRMLAYIGFFILVFKNYGLPINLVRELWYTMFNFHKKLTSLLKYLQLINNLEQRFESATPEELEAAGDCLICREEMTAGKKLPCSHVFHSDCLRMWLQHQQTCPLCRSDIPVSGVAEGPAEPGAGAPAPAVVAGGAGDNMAANEPPAADAAAPPTSASAAAGHVEDAALGASAAPDLQSSASTASSSHTHTARHRSSSSLSVRASAKGVGSVIDRDWDRRPGMYSTVAVCAPLSVHAQPFAGSAVIRNIPQSTVVFVDSHVTDEQGRHWMHIPDGWVCATSAEGCVLLVALTSRAVDEVRRRQFGLGDNASTAGKLLGKDVDEVRARKPRVVLTVTRAKEEEDEEVVMRGRRHRDDHLHHDHEHGHGHGQNSRQAKQTHKLMSVYGGEFSGSMEDRAPMAAAASRRDRLQRLAADMHTMQRNITTLQQSLAFCVEQFAELMEDESLSIPDVIPNQSNLLENNTNQSDSSINIETDPHDVNVDECSGSGGDAIDFKELQQLRLRRQAAKSNTNDVA